MLKGWLQKNGVWTEHLLYLAVCILAFGLFIPFLGFYWDDWPTIFYTHSGRAAQLVNHFTYDRPFSVWGYWLIGRLGTSPIIWHVTALLIRWLIVVAFAWALKPLWPKQTEKIKLLGLLFAIYPGYYLQPSSVIFSSHLLALLFLLISIGAMGRSVVEKKYSLQYTFLAIAATVVHMFTLEYFVGLELVRPLYLWFLFENHQLEERPRKLLKSWLPFLAIAVAWILWRLFLLKLPSEPYPLIAVDTLQASPLQGAFQLAMVGVQDLITVLAVTWVELLPQVLFHFNQIAIISWLLVIVSFALVYLSLARTGDAKGTTETSEAEKDQFASQSMSLGILALITGLAPVWMIGERIAQGDYNLRYMLVALFGAALVVGGLIHALVKQHKYRILVVSALVALSVGAHVRAANDYRLDWVQQREFYWQLYWRAPDLQRGTALLSFERATKYLGDPMTGNALNVLYPLNSVPPLVDLWNFELSRTLTVNAIQNGETLNNDYRGLKFNAQSAESLVFYYLPPEGCLWLLAPNSVENRYLPIENRTLVSESNLAMVLPLPEDTHYPDSIVFGNEPDHTWCYYFEKADLARQFGDWDQVVSLMDEAKTLGLQPNIGIEWLPSLEAYAARGEWSEAVAISEGIHGMHTRNDSMLCAVWRSIIANHRGDEAAMAAHQQISTMAACE